MEFTHDGQIVGAKQFKANFVIPKKKTAEEETSEANNASILENIYSAFAVPNYDQYHPNFYSAITNYTMAPTSYTMEAYGMAPVAEKRTWSAANCSEPPSTSLLRTLGSNYDTTLPMELLAMFQPLYCKLCSAQLSSNVMAKTHYDSKNHDKKVRKFLIEYSERTGEPLHKRAAVPRAQKDEEYDPKHYHCEVCDLSLTGKVHAESHYMGKNHQKVLLGKKAPTGKGYYNTEGKWVRVVPSKTEQVGDGFGANFHKEETATQSTRHTSFNCSICDVSVTSMPQLEMHMQGQKHLKKLKQMANGIVTAGPETVTGHVPAIIIPPTNPDDLLSAYRTPSGLYYCKSCNLSLSSDVQFTQHLGSRKHLKKNTKE